MFPSLLDLKREQVRIGQVRNLTRYETIMKPQVETFTKSRVAWYKGSEQESWTYSGGEADRSEV